jgi:hypothetical protein
LPNKIKLPPKTKGIFDYFIRHANKARLHLSDWDKFYEFINACHDYRVKLDELDLVYMLEKEGFTENYARELANVYYHIREFLKGHKRRLYKRLWPPHP